MDSMGAHLPDKIGEAREPLDLPAPSSLTPRLEVIVQALPRLLLVFAMGVAAIPLAVWLVFWGRGSIEHFAFVFVPTVLLAPVLAIASLGLWLFGFRVDAEETRVRLRWASALALGLTAIAVVIAPTYLPGRLLNSSDVRAARSYCMMLVPRLAAYKEKQGVVSGRCAGGVAARAADAAPLTDGQALLPHRRCGVRVRLQRSVRMGKRKPILLPGCAVPRPLGDVVTRFTAMPGDSQRLPLAERAANG